MFKPFALFVGLRYTRAKRRNHFISFISLISMLGITVGVMALITVLSVMNGFEKELRERILGVVAHATITEDRGLLEDWPRVVQFVSRYPAILGTAPYVQGEGMFTNGSQVSGTLVRGILPAEEPKVSDLANKIKDGRLADLKPGAFGAILGKELAATLGVGVGDKVTLVIPQANVTPAGVLPRLKRFTVVGIFEIGMFEYDSALTLLHIDDAAKLFRLGNNVSGLRLRIQDMLQAPRLTQVLRHELPEAYRVTDWTQQHANFFRAVSTEKTVMFIILLLIVGVAAFNIVSTLVMTVTDKESDIAILRTLGASPGTIMRIFIVQGTIIGLVGTALGVAGGVALASNVETLVPMIENIIGMQFLAPDVYYISELPSELRWEDVTKIGVISFILSMIAAIYPAWRASRTQPAEALRYE